jgi:hypothetical protein
MIKNTEVKYSRREAKLIAQILDAARSEFYKDESDRSGSFKYFSAKDVEHFQALLEHLVLHHQDHQSGADTHRGRRRLARSRNRKASTLSGLFFACANEVGTPLALFALCERCAPWSLCG